jgi:hypothetical protein
MSSFGTRASRLPDMAVASATVSRLLPGRHDQQYDGGTCIAALASISIVGGRGDWGLDATEAGTAPLAAAARDATR